MTKSKRRLIIKIINSLILISFLSIIGCILYESSKTHELSNFSETTIKIQYRSQQDKDVIYFILPEEYASDEMDEYIEIYGKRRNLKLDTIFFEYNCVIYIMKK